MSERATTDPAEGLHPLDIDALVEARHPDPFSKLGLHQTDAGPVVRVLLPGADRRAGIARATAASRSASSSRFIRRGCSSGLSMRCRRTV